MGLGGRELGDRSLLTVTVSLSSQAQAQAQDALARRALSGSSKSTWAGGTCVVRGKLTLMVMEPPAIDCKELKTRHGRVASQKSIQCNAHALTRPRAAGGFADAGLQVVRTCMLVRASLLSLYACYVTTRDAAPLGVVRLDERFWFAARHGALRCTCIGRVATTPVKHSSCLLGSKSPSAEVVEGLRQ